MARKKVPQLPPETREFTYTTAEEMPRAIKDMIYKEWLPRVMAAVLQAVRELPPEHRNHVLKGMSSGCAPLAIMAWGAKPGMSQDEFIKHMSMLPPPLGPRTIEWHPDLVQVAFHPPKGANGRPICHCPMVLLEMIEPFPELCICGANTGACFIEAFTRKPAAKVELLGSPNSTGEQSCRYRVHLKPSIASIER